MKLLTTLLLCSATIAHAQTVPLRPQDDTANLMSEKYWNFWNKDVQAKIEADIEANRKADAIVKIAAKNGTEVRIEQLTHDFVFGAHIFNFNQLGTKERNDKYKALYGTLFNSATLPFYWKDFELEQGKPRFATEYRDTEEFWNNVKVPENEPHWRRPSTDQLVEFCEEKGIRAHGHPLVWGSLRTHYPQWLYEKYTTEAERKEIAPFLDATNIRKKKSEFSEEVLEEYRKLPANEFAERVSSYLKHMETLTENRIREIAEHYQGRIQSWDVCNESGEDFDRGLLPADEKVARSHRSYGLMPGDYAYTAFKISEKYFPEDVLLNINDYHGWAGYAKQVNELKERGAKVDVLGYQMHIFNPQMTGKIAQGDDWTTPEKMWNRLNLMDGAGIPIHVSEITVPTPGESKEDEKIQAAVAANFYRLWFSHKSVMGITWWNVVDGCGYRGEPSTSGLFTRNMEPKASFHALNHLINEEWKTNTTAKVENGEVKFRGFKGNYKLSWTDADGKPQSMEYYLK